jgi:hypothetical protein
VEPIRVQEPLSNKAYLEHAAECRQLASLLHGETGASFLMAELYEQLANEPDEPPENKIR